MAAATYTPDDRNISAKYSMRGEFWTFLFRYIVNSTLREYFTFSCPFCLIFTHNASMYIYKATCKRRYSFWPVTGYEYCKFFSFQERTTLKTGLSLPQSKPQVEPNRDHFLTRLNIFGTKGQLWVSSGMLLFPLRETSRQVEPPLTACLPPCSYLLHCLDASLPAGNRWESFQDSAVEV